MATLPFLPGGQAELPAERFIVFATTANQIVRIDETAVQQIAANFTGEWQSGSLNQLNDAFEFTLSALELHYAALAATTVAVSASGDGGENWSVPQVLALPITAGRVAVVRADFEVTGRDLRFRLQLDTNILVNIFGYRPHMIEAGDLIF